LQTTSAVITHGVLVLVVPAARKQAIRESWLLA
jgi:hypothetical protein